MNYDEKIAESYLQKLKIGEIIFEPNGNISPDFELNKNIAIEVRRLNKHINGKPIENLDFGVIRKVENLISNYKLTRESKVTFPISIKYSRPLNFKNIKDKIYKALSHFENNKYDSYEYFISENFKFDVLNGTERYNSDFEVMMWVDHDKGGYVKYDLRNNIIHALKEKEKLVIKTKSNYSEWWLILINHISSGIRSDELKFLKQEIPRSEIFNKIIILELNNNSESVINYN